MKPGDLARSLIGAARPADISASGSSDRTYGPSPPPPAASEEELDAMRTWLRAAQVTLTQENARLEALRHARERARGERYATAAALDEAEAALAHARKFGRRHLVTAYLKHEEVGGPAPENAQAMRDIAADNTRRPRKSRRR